MSEEEKTENENLLVKNFKFNLKDKNFNISLAILENKEKENENDKNDILSFIIEVENTFPKVIYEKSFKFKDCVKYQQWFRLFDNFNESYESLIYLIDNNNYSLIEETNSVQIIFNHFDKKIKDSIFLIPQKELNQEEILKNLILSHNELRIKVLEIEKKLLDYEKNNNNKIEYKNDLYYTRIFNNDGYIKNIMNWISPDKKIYFNLIYNLAFGNTAKSFHNYCDNKGPTLTVVYATSGYYFGGYTTENWDCSGAYKKDANAFIFSLNNNKYAKASNDNAIYCHSNNFPTFGGGHDLYISDKCNENSNNYNGTNNTYNFGSNYYLNGGSYNFQVSKLEVYQVKILDE